MEHDFLAGPVTASVINYAEALATYTETQLAARLPNAPAEGVPWSGYVEDARSVTFLINLQLNRLTSELYAGLPPTRAGEICRQHHRAYRDLTGALVGICSDEAEQVPGEGEWPVRTAFSHVVDAELGFSLLIDWAVKRQEGGNQIPITMPQEEMAPHYDSLVDTGPWSQIVAQYDALHRRVIGGLLLLTDEQLDALNVWWEGYEIPVWFRMHRFDAHLREHTIQVDKTLAAIGRAPTEAERLARLLHQSLADLELALYETGDSSLQHAKDLASEIDERRRELSSV